MPGSTGRRRRRSSPVAFIISAAVVVAVLFVSAAALMLQIDSAPDAAPVDMGGNRVHLEDPLPEGQTASSPTRARFTVGAVGLDVPLDTLDATDGVIEPPGFTSAYWVENRGVSFENPADGTVFVAMHSLRGGGVAPGNYLIDVQNRRSKVQPGDAITVGASRYTVTQAGPVQKTDIADRSDIWADSPGRLVVITCLQRPQGGPSVQNMVIEAQLQPDSGK